MHAEIAIETAIKDAIAHGWGEGKDSRTIAGEVTRKAHEMVSKEIADKYRIEVDVRLVEKGSGSS